MKLHEILFFIFLHFGTPFKHLYYPQTMMTILTGLELYPQTMMIANSYWTGALSSDYDDSQFLLDWSSILRL